MLLEGRSRNINSRRRKQIINIRICPIISILTLHRMRMQGYCDVYKWIILKRTSPEVKCLHPTLPRREMCKSSVSNVIYHKFSHGAAFYTLNGKNVMLEFSINYRDFSVKSNLIISLFQTVKLSLSISLFQKNRIFVK